MMVGFGRPNLDLIMGFGGFPALTECPLGAVGCRRVFDEPAGLDALPDACLSPPFMVPTIRFGMAAQSSSKKEKRSRDKR